VNYHIYRIDLTSDSVVNSGTNNKDYRTGVCFLFVEVTRLITVAIWTYHILHWNR